MQVESSLNETNFSMNKIIAENRLLKADMGLLNQRSEKLKQAQNKIQSLEKELNEKKEQLADVEK